MEERRLTLFFDPLSLLIGKLLESLQAQSKKVAGARIAVTGEEQDGPGLGAHDELELRITAFAKTVDDLRGARYLHRRTISNMDLEGRRGRVGNDRPVDLTGRETQRPSKRLTDASSSTSSPSGDSAIWWERTPRSLSSEAAPRSSSSS